MKRNQPTRGGLATKPTILIASDRPEWPICRFVCYQDGSEPFAERSMMPPAIDSFLCYEDEQGGYRVVDHQTHFRRAGDTSELDVIVVMLERVTDPDYQTR